MRKNVWVQNAPRGRQKRRSDKDTKKCLRAAKNIAGRHIIIIYALHTNKHVTKVETPEKIAQSSSNFSRIK